MGCEIEQPPDTTLLNIAYTTSARGSHFRALDKTTGIVPNRTVLSEQNLADHRMPAIQALHVERFREGHLIFRLTRFRSA